MSNIYALAHEKAKAAAEKAATDFNQEHFGGKDTYPCGFAWVTFYPENKGNTRLGKAERNFIQALGFTKDYVGNGYRLSNPSGYRGQNVDTKFAGAQAYVETFRKFAVGVKLSAQERLD